MHNNYVISSLLPHVCLGISCTNSSIPPSTWRDQTGDYLPLINAQSSRETFSPGTASPVFVPLFSLSWTGFLAQVLKEYWQLLLLSSPSYHEEPKGQSKMKAASYTKTSVKSCTRQQWGRSDAEGHEREPFRNQNKFLNNSPDQRLATGIPASLQITSLNGEIPAGFPVTA